MDPFSMVFTALWQLACSEGNKLSELVKFGNRIRYDGAREDPRKLEISNADVPELVLVAEGTADSNLHASSCGTSIRRTYAWMLHTGDFRINQHLHPVEFALFCAMADFKSVLGPLTWNGNTFVKDCQLVNVTTGVTDPAKNRGVQGWSAVWRCSVNMHFRTEDLKAYNQNGGS